MVDRFEVDALLADCEAAGVTLRLDGATVRGSGPRGTVTPALSERIREAKPYLLSRLAGYGPLSWTCCNGHVSVGPTASFYAVCNTCGVRR